MTNVVYILNSTYSLGGASKSFLSLISGLKRKGVCPLVVVPDKEGIYADLLRMGVEVIVALYRPNTYPRFATVKDKLLFLPRLWARRWLNRRAVSRLFALLSVRGHVHLVHTNVSVVDIGFRLARRLRVPHVYHIREYGDLDFHEFYFPSWKLFHKRLRVPLSYVICITEGILRHHLLQGYSAARVIYNGIETGTVPGAGDSFEDRKFFLYAGRIEPAKGLDLLLEAYAAYVEKSASGTPLWVAGDAGDDSYSRCLNEYVRSRGLGGHVRFLGPRRDVDVLMRKALAIVIPSRFEAFGRCMPEAMSNGCLVIGRDTGGTKEQFDNGLRLTGAEIGFRFTTVAELAEALGRAESLSEHERTDIVERACRTVRTLYSTDAYVDGVYQFYRDILNENMD